eukprot:g6352.t1
MELATHLDKVALGFITPQEEAQLLVDGRGFICGVSNGFRALFGGGGSPRDSDFDLTGWDFRDVFRDPVSEQLEWAPWVQDVAQREEKLVATISDARGCKKWVSCMRILGTRKLEKQDEKAPGSRNEIWCIVRARSVWMGGVRFAILSLHHVPETRLALAEVLCDCEALTKGVITGADLNNWLDEMALVTTSEGDPSATEGRNRSASDQEGCEFELSGAPWAKKSWDESTANANAHPQPRKKVVDDAPPPEPSPAAGVEEEDGQSLQDERPQNPASLGRRFMKGGSSENDLLLNMNATSTRSCGSVFHHLSTTSSIGSSPKTSASSTLAEAERVALQRVLERTHTLNRQADGASQNSSVEIARLAFLHGLRAAVVEQAKNEVGARTAPNKACGVTPEGQTLAGFDKGVDAKSFAEDLLGEEMKNGKSCEKKSVLLYTTNGTRAIPWVQDARRVVLGSLLNASAVVSSLLECQEMIQGGGTSASTTAAGTEVEDEGARLPIVFVCCGYNRGQHRSMEDELIAAYLLFLLMQSCSNPSELLLDDAARLVLQQVDTRTEQSLVTDLKRRFGKGPTTVAHGRERLTNVDFLLQLDLYANTLPVYCPLLGAFLRQHQSVFIERAEQQETSDFEPGAALQLNQASGVGGDQGFFNARKQISSMAKSRAIGAWPKQRAGSPKRVVSTDGEREAAGEAAAAGRAVVEKAEARVEVEVLETGMQSDQHTPVTARTSSRHVDHAVRADLTNANPGVLVTGAAASLQCSVAFPILLGGEGEGDATAPSGQHATDADDNPTSDPHSQRTRLLHSRYSTCLRQRQGSFGTIFPQSRQQHRIADQFGSLDQSINLKKVRLFAVRHGDYEKSIAKSMVGHLNPTLSDAGRDEAAALASWLADQEKFALVICSPLLRAAMTAELIAAEQQNPLSPQIDSDLTAIDRGDWSGLLLSEIHRFFPGEWAAWCEDPYWDAHGGEANATENGFSTPLMDIMLRVRQSLLKILRRCMMYANEFADRESGTANVCVVTHCSIVCSLIGLVAGLSQRETVPLAERLKPSSVTLIEVDVLPSGKMNAEFSESREPAFVGDVKYVGKTVADFNDGAVRALVEEEMSTLGFLGTTLGLGAGSTVNGATGTWPCRSRSGERASSKTSRSRSRAENGKSNLRGSSVDALMREEREARDGTSVSYNKRVGLEDVKFEESSFPPMSPAAALSPMAGSFAAKKASSSQAPGGFPIIVIPGSGEHRLQPPNIGRQDVSRDKENQAPSAGRPLTAFGPAPPMEEENTGAQGDMNSRQELEAAPKPPRSLVASSPLRRARVVAERIAAELDALPIVLNELTAQDAGDWTGLTEAEDLQGVVGVGNAVAARSLQQLAENGQRKLQAQTGDSLGPFIPGDGAGRNSRATRLQRLAADLRCEYQDRGISGLQLTQQMDLERGTLDPHRKLDDDPFSKASAKASGSTFLNDLHTTLQTSIDEQQKDALTKAQWRTVAKLQHDWEKMRSQILQQIRAGAPISAPIAVGTGSLTRGQSLTATLGQSGVGLGPTAAINAHQFSKGVLMNSQNANFVELEREVANVFLHNFGSGGRGYNTAANGASSDSKGTMHWTAAQQPMDKVTLDVSRASLLMHQQTEYLADLKFLWELVMALVGTGENSVNFGGGVASTPGSDVLHHGGNNNSNVETLLERGLDFLRSWAISQMRERVAQLPTSGEQDLGTLLVNFGILSWDDSSFPSTPAHCWFLIFYATRTHSVALLQQLGQDARIRQCIAGTPEAHSLFTVVIPHLIALLEGTSPEPVAGLETLFQNQTGLAATSSVASGGHGSIFRELCLQLVMGYGFPTAIADGPARSDARDCFNAVMRNSETLIWFGLLQVRNQRLPLEEFQDGINELLYPSAQLDDVKYLFLSLQFARGLRTLQHRNPETLSAATVHFSLILAKSRLLDVDFEKFDYVRAIIDYSTRLFDVSEQLQYLLILHPADRKTAYVRILRSFASLSDELVGAIQYDGSHFKGLLERSCESNEEYRAVTEAIGRDALRRGRYVEALRLLHLSQCYGDVLRVLHRVLRMSITATVAGAWAPLTGAFQRRPGTAASMNGAVSAGGGSTTFLDQGGGFLNASSASMDMGTSMAAALGNPVGSVGDASSGRSLGYSSLPEVLNAEVRKFLTIYADYGSAFGVTPDLPQWRFVCRLWRLKHFFDCSADQGRVEEALELFDREDLLGEGFLGEVGNANGGDQRGGSAGSVAEKSGAVVEEQLQLFPIDYSRIVEAYLTILTKRPAGDHGRQRVMGLQTFLSQHPYVSLTRSARKMLTQLALR